MRADHLHRIAWCRHILDEAPCPALPIFAAVLSITVAFSHAESPTEARQGTGEYTYHHQALGTSLDLVVVAAARTDADAAEKAILHEIERLRKILSTYDTTSELAKLNTASLSAPPIKASTELIDVLTGYEQWQQRSEGAYSGHIGDLVDLWRKAEKRNSLPTDDELGPVVRQMAQPAWRMNEQAGTVQRLTNQKINIDSLGKGYIIGRAVEAACREVSGLAGILLNIGGDIRVAGSSELASAAPWHVGVTDPAHHEDNAAPLTVLVLKDQAVATSAAYERFYSIGGKRYSHILDARTGKPTSAALSATVVAKDNATANALATILCILPPVEGLRLVQSTSGAQCLIVSPDGKQLRSEGFHFLEAPADPKSAAASRWPQGFQVIVSIDLSKARKRPYHFVWVTDENNNHVKTLAAYGTEPKYLKEMRDWWKIAQADPSVKALTRATRRAGRYSYVWDGTDQKGRPMPPGTYRVFLESAWEKGPHATRSAHIACRNEPAAARIEASPAFAESNITYGPPRGN